MAHYAFLDENNIVTEVITGVDEDTVIDGLDPETWYARERGQVCKRTSYNTCYNKHNNGGTPYRGNYAGVGYFYDSDWDVFIPPKPYPSWVLNYNVFDWEAPVPKPTEQLEGYVWRWAELRQEWVQVKIS